MTELLPIEAERNRSLAKFTRLSRELASPLPVDRVASIERELTALEDYARAAGLLCKPRRKGRPLSPPPLAFSSSVCTSPLSAPSRSRSCVDVYGPRPIATAGLIGIDGHNC
jgi:hypothetical protein